MEDIFQRTSTATDIKGLADKSTNSRYRDMDPTIQSLGVCTVDGQRMDFGDATHKFPVAEIIRPVLYCQGLSQLGLDTYDTTA